jgi:uncharacterized protein
MERVRKLGKFINSVEQIADPFILELASILHDAADSKFNGGNRRRYADMEDFLDKAGLKDSKHRIIEVINNVSFSNKKPSGNLNDPVLLVLQDADRLDAIGAIGIARAFNYGGFRNNPIYEPKGPEGSRPSTIGHFYEKLLKLKDLMNTSTARRLAEERQLILVRFLEQFYKEWEFASEINNKFP